MATTGPPSGEQPKRIEHGFEAVFSPALEVRLQCPVCWSALRDPVQTKCGHRFCRACLKRCCMNRFGKCPVDNTWLDTQKEIFSDSAIMREVLSLNIKCSLHEDGCTWRGELRDEENKLKGKMQAFGDKGHQTHNKECHFVEETCKNGCAAVRKREDMERHLVECPLRVVQCPHCRDSIAAIDSTKHQVLACPKFPVNCGVCGETGILREDVPRHMDLEAGDCPLVTVNCPFFNIGCYFQTKRKNMEEHVRTCVNRHMQLLSTKQMCTTEMMTSMRESLDSLRLLVADLKTQIKEMQPAAPPAES